MNAGSGVCPFCGVRSDINLRNIQHRDLGSSGSLPCPDCQTVLEVIEFDAEPKVQVERCGACFGLFFNPGELQIVLEKNTNSLVWLDRQQLKQIAADYGFDQEVVYLKCPYCGERMSRINFGGSSGVILDHCGNHGVWLQNIELRRLLEWWHAGGKLIYQQREDKQARIFSGAAPKESFAPTFSTGDSAGLELKPAAGSLGTGIESVVVWLAHSLLD